MLPVEISGGTSRLRAVLAEVEDAGLDFVGMGDHVAFRGGFGVDGLVTAAAMLAAHPTLRVATSVYLLPLRHPVAVARQLSTVAALAPGRFTFGVGLGGDDPDELRACGVDPRTRGRRMNESLTVLRRLLAGDAVTSRGEFFELDGVRVLPAPDPPVPIVVGGRSEAAVRRAGRLGDGWLGIWVSPQRFAAASHAAAVAARQTERGEYPARHGLQVWCGFGATEAEAPEPLAAAMESLYGLPFERFARYSPAGPPAKVAEFLAAYVDAGCTSFSLVPRASTSREALESAAEVRRLLVNHAGKRSAGRLRA